VPEGTHSGSVVDQVDVESVPRPAAGILNAVSSVQSSIFIGSELGEVGLVDWLKNKDGPVATESGLRGDALPSRLEKFRS